MADEAKTRTETEYKTYGQQRYQAGHTEGYNNGVTDAINIVKNNINSIFTNVQTSTSSNASKVQDIKLKLSSVKSKCSSNAQLTALLNQAEESINEMSYAINGETYNALLQILTEANAKGTNIVNNENKHLILSLYAITGLLSYTNKSITITQIYNAIKTNI